MKTVNKPSSERDPQVNAFHSRPVLWIAAALLAAFSLLVLRPLFTGETIATNDVREYYFPLRWWFGQQLQSGLPFWWTPQIYNGFYIHAEGQLGMLHPLHLLLYRLLPAYAAFGLNTLLSLWALAAGVYFLLRRWGASSHSAAIGALLGSFMGYPVLRVDHPNILEAWAHTPWILLTIDHLFAAPNGRRRLFAIGAIGLLTASQIYMGSPPMLVCSLLFEFAYLLYWMSSPRKFPTLLQFGLAKGLGALAASAQLIPTLLLAREDPLRSAPGLDFLGGASFHPADLLQVWNPAIVDTHGVSRTETLAFYGTGTVLLAVAWSIHGYLCKSLTRREKFLIAAGLFFLFLSLGRFNGLFPFYTLIPPFSLLRAPARFLAVVHLVLVALAALGLDGWIQAGRFPEKTTSVLTMASVLLASGSLLLIILRIVDGPWRAFMVEGFPSLPLAVAGSLLVTLSALAFASLLRPRSSLWRQAAIGILVAEPLLYYGRTIVRFPVASLEDMATHAPPVPVPGPVADVRSSDQLILRGYTLVGGHSSLSPASAVGLRSLAAERLVGVRAVRRKAGGPWELVSGQPISRIRLFDKVEVRKAPVGSLDDTDIHRQAVTELDLPLKPRSSGSVEIQTDRPGHIEFRTNTTGIMLALITERYHPGWRAADSAMVVRADGDLMGVLVPAGTHITTLEFHPPYMTELLTISGASGLALCTLLVLGYKKPR